MVTPTNNGGPEMQNHRKRVGGGPTDFAARSARRTSGEAPAGWGGSQSSPPGPHGGMGGLAACVVRGTGLGGEGCGLLTPHIILNRLEGGTGGNASGEENKRFVFFFHQEAPMRGEGGGEDMDAAHRRD